MNKGRFFTVLILLIICSIALLGAEDNKNIKKKSSIDKKKEKHFKGSEEEKPLTTTNKSSIVQGYNNSYALCIGINNYTSFSPLSYAVDDARKIGELFTNLGFQNVKFLLDKEATLKNILEEIDKLSTVTSKNDRVVIYFSGHGDTEAGERGDKIGYIVPVDFPKGGSKYLSAISMTRLKEASKRIKAKHILYLIDSCYSGTGLMESKADQSFVAESTEYPVTFMITAGKEGEKSIETDGHGLFTNYLLRAFEGPADVDKNGVISASELGNYLKTMVSNKAKVEFRAQQNPQYGRWDGDGEIVFELYGKLTISKNRETKLKDVNINEEKSSESEKIGNTGIIAKDGSNTIDSKTSNQNSVNIDNRIETVKNKTDAIDSVSLTVTIKRPEEKNIDALEMEVVDKYRKHLKESLGKIELKSKKVAIFQYEKDTVNISKTLDLSGDDTKFIDLIDAGRVLGEEKVLEKGRMAGADYVLTGDLLFKKNFIEKEYGFFSEYEKQRVVYEINTKLLDTSSGYSKMADIFKGESEKYLYKKSVPRAMTYIPALILGTLGYTAYYFNGMPDKSEIKDSYGNPASDSEPSKEAIDKWNKKREEFDRESIIVGVVDLFITLGLGELGYRILP